MARLWRVPDWWVSASKCWTALVRRIFGYWLIETLVAERRDRQNSGGHINRVRPVEYDRGHRSYPEEQVSEAAWCLPLRRSLIEPYHEGAAAAISADNAAIESQSTTQANQWCNPIWVHPVGTTYASTAPSSRWACKIKTIHLSPLQSTSLSSMLLGNRWYRSGQNNINFASSSGCYILAICCWNQMPPLWQSFNMHKQNGHQCIRCGNHASVW